MSLFETANRLKAVGYKLEAIDRYRERLAVHIDSALCVSDNQDEWDIATENCLTCKDFMTRIEEHEKDMPAWVGRLAWAWYIITFAWLRDGVAGRRHDSDDGDDHSHRHDH